MDLSSLTLATRLPSGLKHTPHTASDWSVMVCTHDLWPRSHSLTVLSLEHDTSALPDGLAATPSTQLLWPGSASIRLRCSTSYMWMWPSSHAVNSVLESTLNASDRTGMAWPSRVCSSFPDPVSNTATVPSMAPHATRRPSPLYATLCTKRPCLGLSADGAGSDIVASSAPPPSLIENSLTAPLVPPATAMCCGSSTGWNASSQFSAGGLSITHFVSCVSTSHTRMKLSSALDATRPLALTASATTPSVCPV
mmetsp:Transcript_33252/g.81714  ORF Transcript_33252/g.81714 Transcript_33252/m.81714 type:complete len:252 (+) Transcript_33252:151-906(+)